MANNVPLGRKAERTSRTKDKPEVAKTVLELMENTVKRNNSGFTKMLGRDQADIFKMQVKAVGKWVNEFEDEKKIETEELG